MNRIPPGLYSGRIKMRTAGAFPAVAFKASDKEDILEANIHLDDIPRAEKAMGRIVTFELLHYPYGPYIGGGDYGIASIIEWNDPVKKV